MTVAFTVRPICPDTEPRCFALIGPEGRVWHESWSESLLVKLAVKYNEIYALGFDAADRQAGKHGLALKRPEVQAG